MPPHVVPGRPGPAIVGRTHQRPFVRVAIAACVLGITVLATLVPGVVASPPAGTTGGWIEVTPKHGTADEAVSAAYWFVPAAAGACPPSVTFLWDGKPVGTFTPKAGWACATTPISFAFAPPTTTTTSHRVTGCYYRRGVCVSSTQSNGTYVIDPTPTLVVSPGKGLVAAPFTATYATGQTTCSFTEAQFFWEGAAFGRPVPIDRVTCSAAMTFAGAPKPHAVGGHPVSALACVNSTCRFLPAAATYAVLPPPTAKPTAAPTAAPLATAAPTPVPSASPSAPPRPSATAVATPSASPSSTSSPTPAGTHARPTAPPAPPSPPAGVPAGGAGIPPDAPPPPPNTYVPALVSSLSVAEPGAVDPAVVTTNLFLTLLIVFLFMLTSEVFNSTMDANRDEVHGWWRRIFGGPLRLAGALNAGGSGLSRLAGSGRLASIGRVVAVLALLGLIYGFLSPDFGLNQQSAIWFLSLVLGLGFLTYFNEASATRLARRRYHATASIQLYGTAVVVAVIAVVVSRTMSFQPGLLYGFIASAVIVAPVALGKRDDAILVLVPAFGLLVISILAWLLLGPVRAAAADGAAAPALAESVLGMVLVGGLEGLLFTMLPLTFLDGAAVMRWSRLGWALAFGTAVFLWWQLLLNRDSAYAAALEQTNVRIVLATLGVFMLTTGGIWSYFRFRPRPAEVETSA